MLILLEAISRVKPQDFTDHQNILHRKDAEFEKKKQQN